MNNPWNDTDAFLPMFTDTIGISGTRPNSNQLNSSIEACVFPCDDVSPFGDTDIETDVKSISIIINPVHKKLVQVGDTITLEDGTKFRVSEVKQASGFIRLTARSI